MIVPVDRLSVNTDDGASLRASVHGNGSPTVVFVHGFTLDASVWDKVIEHLPDVTAITYDLRGHGHSSLGSDQPDLSRLVADLSAILDGVDRTGVHVVGHSLGAFVALAARTDPTTTERLASVSAISAMDRSITNPMQRLAARVFSSGLGVAMLGRSRIGRSMIRPWFGPDPSSEQLDDARLMSARCTPPARNRIAATTSKIDLRPSLAQPGCPTLILCGEHDQATPPSHSERIAATIDNSELAISTGAGHMVITEQPVDVASTLLDWINRHPDS